MKLIKQLLGASALAASLGWLPAAAAQERTAQNTTESENQDANRDASGTQEIIVTARKRSEAIIDVPASISAVTRDQLRDLGGVTSINDLGYLLPGISFINTGNINSEINIRGAGSGTARTAGVDSPIAVLKDDVSIVGGQVGGRTYTRADLFDIDRIEVTRGPQGALYGVNAVGGVMNIITARPRHDFGAELTADYGFELQRYGIEGVVNVPLTSTLAVRAGYQHSERHDGFFRNAADGRAGDIENYDGGRASALWSPQSGLDVYATLDISNELSPSNRVKSVNFLNDPTGLTPTQIGPPDVDGPFLFGANTSNAVNRDLLSGLFRVDAQAPFGKVTWVTLFRNRFTDFRQDEDGSFVGYAQPPFPAATCATRLCTTRFIDRTKLYSSEVRAAGNIASHLGYLLGVNFANRQSDFATISDGRTTSATNLTLSPNQNQGNVSNDDEFQYGVFGDLDWKPLNRLTITAAGRYNWSEKSLDAYTVPRLAGTTSCNYLNPIAGVPDIARVPPCVSARALLRGSFQNFAPSVSVQYKFSPKFNVYSTVAVGYRAGGFNANTVLDPLIPATFDPEKSLAYEIGAKGEIFGARVSLAGFYNDFDSLLVTNSRIDAANVTRNFRINAGKAETYGVDFEATGRTPLPSSLGRLNYTLAVNWLDGKIKDGIYAGKKVEGSPEWTFSASGIYRVGLFRGVDLVAAANYRLQRGGFFNTTSISNRIPNADIDLLDVKIGLETRQWRLELNAQNVTDEIYETLRDPQRSVYGDPRTVTLRLAYRFGSEAGR